MAETKIQYVSTSKFSCKSFTGRYFYQWFHWLYSTSSTTGAISCRNFSGFFGHQWYRGFVSWFSDTRTYFIVVKQACALRSANCLPQWVLFKCKRAFWEGNVIIGYTYENLGKQFKGTLIQSLFVMYLKECSLTIEKTIINPSPCDFNIKIEKCVYKIHGYARLVQSYGIYFRTVV